MPRHIAILLLLLAGLYLAAVNDHWAPKSDSALYVGLGRSLAEGRGMQFNGQAQWGIPPVLPILLAGCRLLVGDHYWLGNLCVTAFGLATIVLAYLAIRRLSADLPASVRDTVTLGALLVVGTSARLFIDSTLLMTDVPCACLVTAGLYAFVRGRTGHGAWYLAGAAVAGLAVLTRLPAAFFFAGFVVAAGVDAWRRGRKGVLLAVAGAVLTGAGLFLVWLVVFRSRVGAGAIDYLSPSVLRRLSPFRPGKAGDLAAALAVLPDALTSTIVYQKLSWFGLVPAGLMAVGLVRAARRRQWVLVLPVVFYVGFLVYWAPSAVASRYLLPAMAMLVYLLLVGVATVARPVRKALARAVRRLRQGDRPGWLRRAGAWTIRAEWRGARVAVSVAVGIALAISLPKVGREIYWMRNPRFLAVYDGGRWVDYQAMAEALAARAAAADRCLTPKGAVVHYWSGVVCDSAVEWDGAFVAHLTDLPPPAFARMAAARGYTFIAVPTDEGAWSRAVPEAMAETGAFAAPPARFGDLALFQRKDGTGAGNAPP